MGEHPEIVESLASKPVTAPCFISMHFLLHCLRGNAKTAGITLPQLLRARRGRF